MGRAMKNTRKEKSYRCPLCTRCFVRKWNVKNHMRGVHSGIEPYRCIGCDASFKWRTQLTIHLKKTLECAHVHRFMEAAAFDFLLPLEPHNGRENTNDFFLDDIDAIPEIQCSPTTSVETHGCFADYESKGTFEHVPASEQSFASDVNERSARDAREKQDGLC